MVSPFDKVSAEGYQVIAEYHISTRRQTQEIRRQICRRLVRRLTRACSGLSVAFVADYPLVEPPET